MAENGKKFGFLFLSLFAKKIFKKSFEILLSDVRKFITFSRDKYTLTAKQYEEDTINSFTDSLVAAKNKAIAEGKESGPYLTEANLGMVLFDLFFGMCFENIIIINLTVSGSNF